MVQLETGPEVDSGRAAEDLGDRFGPRPGELDEQVAPTAQERPQQARDGDSFFHETVEPLPQDPSEPDARPALDQAAKIDDLLGNLFDPPIR